MTRPTRVEVNLSAVQHNFRKLLGYFSSQISTEQIGVFVAAKDDAYGHGLIPVAKALIAVSHQVGFALCSLNEALYLIQADIKQPVLLLNGFFSVDELPLISHYQMHCVVHSEWQVAAILKAQLPHPVKVWLKANTGMNRLGLPLDLIDKIYRQLQSSAQVADVVLMSHLACADLAEHPLNNAQINRFVQWIQAYPRAEISLFNSAGILNYYRRAPTFCVGDFASLTNQEPYSGSLSRKQWLRPGLMIYGASPLAGIEPDALGLKQSMSLKSNIISLYSVKAGESVGYGATYTTVKPTNIALVPLGYGDGYPFVPSGTKVLIGHDTAEIIGRVSMDLIALDVSAVSHVKVGSEVIFWNQSLPINRIAEKIHITPHMLMTSLTNRVPRYYTSDPC